MSESHNNTKEASSNKFSEQLKAIIVLFRPQQYYKNLLIFFGIFFSKRLLETNLYLNLLIGFFCMCFVSSINYILNDVKDKERDSCHPENKKRPIASGRLGISMIIMIIIGLLILNFAMILLLDIEINHKIDFLIVLILIFLTSQVYTLKTKNIIFADVITLSMNGLHILHQFVLLV